MISVREYVDATGASPCARWFSRLEPVAAARVATALYRLEQGNTTGLKSLGGGLFEQRLDFGPGYRIYLGWERPMAVLLLGGGTKRRQAADVAAARASWLDFRRRRAGEGPAKEGAMPLTREFRETVMARVRGDARFREALFTEALAAFLSGEAATGRAMLRDLVNATVGFEALSRATGLPAKSLHRMLGPSGNPSGENLFAIVRALQEGAKVQLRVTAAPAKIGTIAGDRAGSGGSDCGPDALTIAR